MTSNCTSSVLGLRAVALPTAARTAPMVTITSVSLLSTAKSSLAGFAPTVVAAILVGGLSV